ncbi:MAG: hypothetical protein AB7I18_07715 [Candidatus Berkiella sp.]
MPTLTIADIQYKLQAGELPKDYAIKTPIVISSQKLVWTLMLFKDNEQMLHFISLLSENEAVTIEVNKKNIQQGSVDRFVHAYAEHGFFPQELDNAKQQHILTFLRRNQFAAKELIYLLKNLSDESINNFLLASRCFSEKDLLALCNDIDTLKKLSGEKIKLLYHYFNKCRRWEESLTPLLDMHYFAYRAGHVMGLKGDICVTIDTHQFRFATEYAPGEVSLKILSGYLDAYSQSQQDAVFSAISHAVKMNWALMVPNTSHYGDDAGQKIYEQYKRNEMTFISCGWPGHSVGLVLHGNYLVYTNRGVGGDPKYGSKIFSISDRSKITAEFIETLLDSRSPNEFHRTLDRIINFKKPVVRFLSKHQKYANCTFANPKSSIEPMIVLQRAGPFASQVQLRQIARLEQGRRKYKQFTTFVRDREVDELVKNMFYAKHPHLVQFFATLVKRIIIVHHGKRNSTIKDKQEQRRALDLFERTPEAIQKIIREDEVWMGYYKAFQATQPVPQANPMLLHQYTTVVNNKDNRHHRVELDKGYITAIDGVQTPKAAYSFKNARKLCTQVLKSW